MGWSIDTVRGEIDTIFANMEKQYRLTHVGAETPMVMIQYEGEIEEKVMKVIVNLFPEFVYINFVPDTSFPSEQPIAETH